MDKDSISRTRRTSLEEYLRSRGEVLLKEGRQFRVKKHSGLVVSGDMWYRHTLLKGGDTIDYLIGMEGVDFKKAVGILLHGSTVPVVYSGTARVRQVALPKRNADDKRAMAYLTKIRGISAEVTIPLLKKGRIYEAARTHNAVFTGVDETGTIRYAMQRSTIPRSSMKLESEGSDKRFSFSLGRQSEDIYIFESVTDLLSFISLKPGIMHDRPHMLSLGGVSDIALEAYIERTSGIYFMIFCLDNDPVGSDAYLKFCDKYSHKGFHVFKWSPEEKDWNQQLLKDTGAV